MADRTEFIPLGGSLQRTDVNNPIEVIDNFVPVIESPTIGGKKHLRMMKRRGYANRLVAPASGYFINECMQWTGVLGTGSNPSTNRGVIVYSGYNTGVGLKLYKWNTSETELGTFATPGYKCIGIQETLIIGVANLTLNIAINTPAQKLLFFPNGGALAEVVDADFPTTTIGRGVHMDGYYFIASTDGYIYVSDLNSISSWTANNRIAVQMEPDTLVGLGKIRNVIVAFGTKSMEFYQNSGASGQPLARISQAGLKTGCQNGSCIQQIGEAILVVSNSSEGIGVHMLEGFALRKVSTSLIDQVLNASLQSPLLGGFNYIPGLRGVTTHHGVSGIALNTNDAKYFYFPQADIWGSETLAYGDLGQALYSNASGSIFTNNGAGELLYFQGAAPIQGTDWSSAAQAVANLTAYIQTVPMTHGTARTKFYKSARLIGDQQTVATPVIYSTSDDNGATFVTRGTFDMSVNPIVPITRMGASRKRIHKLSNTSAGGCVLDALALTYEEGSN